MTRPLTTHQCCLSLFNYSNLCVLAIGSVIFNWLTMLPVRSLVQALLCATAVLHAGADAPKKCGVEIRSAAADVDALHARLASIDGPEAAAIEAPRLTQGMADIAGRVTPLAQRCTSTRQRERITAIAERMQGISAALKQMQPSRLVDISVKIAR